jgi:integrase
MPLSNVNFNLRHHGDEAKKSAIMLRVSYNNNRFFCDVKDSVGELLKIYPACWDKKLQSPKPQSALPRTSMYTSEKDNLINIKETLDIIRHHWKSIIAKARDEGITVTNGWLLSELGSLMGWTEKKAAYTLQSFFEETIRDMETGKRLNDKHNNRHSPRRYKEKTIDHYRLTLNYITEYGGDKPLSDIDRAWYDGFIFYLTDNKNFVKADGKKKNTFSRKLALTPSSTGLILTDLKSVLKYAVEKGISRNTIFDRAWYVIQRTDKKNRKPRPYLTEAEIEALHNFDTASAGFYKTFDIAKDLFVLGCKTGLRVSDFNKGLSGADFKDITLEGKKYRLLNVVTKKTGITVNIPVDSIIEKIFEKYDCKLPIIEEVLLRKYIKQICKRLHGFDEIIKWNESRGGKIIEKTAKRWELISTHTARRSFITNCVLKELPPMAIGKITGQKTVSIIEEYCQAPDSLIALAAVLNHRELPSS